MKKYKLYLFDFDYTLVNSEEGIVRCFMLTLEKLGYKIPEREFICKTIGLPMRKAVGIVIDTADEQKITDFIDVYKTFADKYMTAGTKFFPHTLNVLEKIREQGAKCAIISTKTRHRIEEKFIQTDTMNLVDKVFGCDDVSEFKPSPEGINKAAKLFAVAKSETLYAGDSYVDAGAAENAGVDFVALTTGTTTKEQFKKYPHIKIIDDIGALLD